METAVEPPTAVNQGGTDGWNTSLFLRRIIVILTIKSITGCP